MTHDILVSWHNLPVAAFIDLSRDWKWDELVHFLVKSVCAKLHSMPQPMASLGADDPMSAYTSDGFFSTKSAYNFLMHVSFPPHHNIWREIWGWPRLQKIHSFFLLAVKHGVMTNEFQLSRFLTNDATCPRSGDAIEDLLHMLYD